MEIPRSARFVLGSILFIFVLLLPTARAQELYYFTTDQTGAQTQIDTNHVSSWYFGVNYNIAFAGGQFSMKSGNAVTGDVTFGIFAGQLSDASILSGTNSAVASVTLTYAEFAAQANPGQFATHSFIFSNPVTLTLGSNYTAAVFSTVPDVQSQAYFIKDKPDSEFAINTSTGATNTTALVPGGVTPGPSPIPEPSTYALFGMGALGLVVVARRRRSQKNAG